MNDVHLIGRPGKKDELAKLVAVMPGVQARLASEAHRIEMEAKVRAAPHFKTGEMESSIHVERGAVDHHVVMEGPGVWHKEFGHWYVRSQKHGHNKSGITPRLKYRVKWVPGLFIMTNSANSAAARGRPVRFISSLE